MKKNYLYLTIMLLLCFSWQGNAQEPDLPIKADLDTDLRSDVRFNGASVVDTIIIPYSDDEFTLELKTKINESTGRGLDVQMKNSFGLGLRTSLNKTNFDLSTSLSNLENLSKSVDYGQEQTFRYVVKDGQAHIYQDGAYLKTTPLSALSTDADTDSGDTSYGSDNLIGAWAGFPDDNDGKPTDYGWANPDADFLFNTANSNSGVRYVDGVSGQTFEDDGSVFDGRIMYIRWDNNDYSNSVYSFPVELEAGIDYNFSWIYELVANASPGAAMTVTIASNPDGSGVIDSKTFVTGDTRKLRRGDISFVSQTGGTYYLTITGDYALFGIGELQLKSSNLINQWDGFAVNNKGTPAEYGWENTTADITWNTANANSGVRYMDVTSGHTLEADDSSFRGRLLYVRWDADDIENSTYTFPVVLQENTAYKLSLLYELVANAGAGATMNLSVASANDGSGVIDSKTLIAGNAFSLKNAELTFNTSSQGTYYVTLTGDHALFAIGNLELSDYSAPSIVLGKNYTEGAVDMVLSSVTYENKAYAPEKINEPSSVALELLEGESRANSYAKSKLTLGGTSSLYLGNACNPLINSTVDITSQDAQLYFENVKPSDLINDYLSLITINGAQAVNDENVYVSQYGAGASIKIRTSSGDGGDNAIPLQVFTGENFTGDAQNYEIVTPYKDLGTFDNAIKSFKLKKGFMATFASQSDGTGYSRVFIAQDEDIEIPVMPAFLNETVSFIRTMRWHDVSKKGLAGGDAAFQNATNITWYYNWNTGGTTTPNIEYVPIRHNLYWPSFGPANTKEGYTHLLGYNEPDRPDQADISVGQAINGWPEYMQSGLRLGSPATSDPFNPWMAEFMDEAEKRNYRVDYMALHCYWYKSASQWASDLQYIYDKYKRPIWITEWNIGANWTDNSFPDDANMLTDANATKHRNDLIAILDVLDNTDYVERYSIYNWVQDARAMVVTIDAGFKERNPDYETYEWLEDAPVVSNWEDEAGEPVTMVLTPAGEYYANNDSKKAYDPEMEYVTAWTPLVDSLSYSSDLQEVEIKWTGNNQDLVSSYILERKLEGESEFSVFYESDDYTKISVIDETNVEAEYRLTVISKDDTETISPILKYIPEEATAAPTITDGEALSTSIIKLSWDAVENADSYNLKRAYLKDGTYEVIANTITDTFYKDQNLDANTSYYYKLSTFNKGGESPDSEAIEVSTLTLTIPNKVSDLRLGSSDAKVKMEWDAMYDAEYEVKRSSVQSGPFTSIATVSENNYTDSAVTNGEIYYYIVSAFNEAGEGESSMILEANPNLGQHLYYDFEEGLGTTAYDQWGNYTGILANTSTWGDGKYGSAVKFNGTGSSFVHLENGIMENLNDFTIATWVNIKKAANNSRIFDFGFDTSSWMVLIPYYGGNQIRYKITYGGESNELLADYTLPTDQWVHLTLVQDGNTARIYVNGEEIASGPITLKPSGLGNTTANYLIKSQWPNDPFLESTLDEFKIFNRALSTSEIDKIMDSPDLNTENWTETDRKYTFYSSNHMLYVNSTSNERAEFNLYDISGKFLKSGFLNEENTTNLGQFMTGMYILKIISEEGLQVSKVVVRK